MNDQPMRETGPLCRWQNLAQVALDLGRVLLARKSQTSRQPPAVRVDGDTRNIKRVTTNHVGSLATDAGKRRQLFHSRRHFTAELLHQLLGAAFEGLGLGAKQTEAANV